MELLQMNYEAAMVLAGVGDAMGYKCGDWEFCFDGEKIHAECKAMGGVKELNVKKPTFIVSKKNAEVCGTDLRLGGTLLRGQFLK